MPKKPVLVGVKYVGFPLWLDPTEGVEMEPEGLRPKHEVTVISADRRTVAIFNRLQLPVNGRDWSALFREKYDDLGEEYTEEQRYYAAKEVAAMVGLPVVLDSGVAVRAVPRWVTPEIREAVETALDLKKR